MPSRWSDLVKERRGKSTVSAGAYGLQVELDGGEGLLGPAGADWMPWELRVDCSATGLERPPAGSAYVDQNEAMNPIDGGGWALVDRLAATTTFRLAAPPGAPALAHPLLSFTGAVVAWWRGHNAFHAGAFVVAQRTWAVIGAKQAGKSSLLAALAEAGHQVLSDDLLVIRDGRCLAGPRAIDLRAEVSARFPRATPTASIAGRTRWRLPLGAVAAEAPLAGWITLGWSDRARLIELPVVERMPLVAGAFAIHLPPPDLPGLLGLAALPMLRFERPRELDQLDVSARVLAERLADKRDD